MTSNLTKQHETIGVVFLFDVMLLLIPSCLAYTDCTCCQSPTVTYASQHHITHRGNKAATQNLSWWICMDLPQTEHKVTRLYAHISMDQRSRVFFQHAACTNTMFHSGCVQVTRLLNHLSTKMEAFFGSESPRVPPLSHHFPTSFPPGHQGWKISKPCKKYDMFLSHTCPGSKESQRTSSGVSRTICNPKSPHIPQII